MTGPPGSSDRLRRGDIVAVNGSRSPLGRCHTLCQAAVDAAGGGWVIDLSEISADALLGRTSDGYLSGAIAAVTEVQRVVLVTPVVRTSYSAQMKAFLDVLPRRALVRKQVLLGGTATDRFLFRRLDDALREVVEALGGELDDETIYAMAEDFGPDGRPGAEIRRALEWTFRPGARAGVDPVPGS